MIKKSGKLILTMFLDNPPKTCLIIFVVLLDTDKINFAFLYASFNNG